MGLLALAVEGQQGFGDILYRPNGPQTEIRQFEMSWKQLAPHFH